MQIDTLTVTPQHSIKIVRDDLLPGGTKIRGIIPYLNQLNPQFKEFVYASPAYGYAQVAIAISAQTLGKKAIIFVAKRNKRHPNTALAESYGAKIMEVPYGYLIVIKRRALDYCNENPAHRYCLPWGLHTEEFKDILVQELDKVVSPSFKTDPINIWLCVGSGTIFECLTKVCHQAKFSLVQIGAEYQIPDILKSRVIKLYVAPEKFAQEAKYPPSYPANSWYDAKVWQFVEKHAQDGDVVWNVA